VKYADGLVLLAKGETVLRCMIDIIIEIGRCYRMEKNVEKTKAMRITRQPSSIYIMVHQKLLANVKYFNYLGSLITRKIKSRIGMAKAAFIKKAFDKQIGLKFKE
jgi:hypothetical protein